MDVPASLQIRRKPIAVPVTAAPITAPPPPRAFAVPSLTPGPEFEEKPPPLPARPGLGRPISRGGAEPLLQIPHGHGLRRQKSMPELSRFAADPPPPSPFNAVPATTAATFGPGVGDSKRNFMQTAVSEARHFAAGLIPQATESTKQYTILRHSPPLIFYRGPSTSVTITIFSSPDHPLPADRTLWLQQRGFSGDSGMKLKAFFKATDGWLHVTPSTQVQAHQVEPDTDRAWQRDISKVAKKALKEKGEKKAHVSRETHVIRIPEASDDGYFRLILCTGKGTPYETNKSSFRCKTLCTSPIFRVASTSTDSSVFRGASLSTMPLEMGVFVASMVATTTVNKYTAPVRAPVETVANKIRPGFLTETIGGLVRDELSERSAERDAERDQAYFTAHQAHVTRSLAAADINAIYPIGPDSGPEPPFPLQFQGKVIPGTGRSQAELNMPTANLSGVPDEIRYRLNGIYFGWAACVQPTTPTPDITWHEAIITIAPNPDARPSVTPKPLVAVHLLNLNHHHHSNNPTNNTLLLNQTLQVITMGLLRPTPSPSPPPQQKARLDAASRDVCLTLVSLARENWVVDSEAVRSGLLLQNNQR
ncbi:hypothetical protein C8A00DRAFT_19520, partial [Chaetomidium leptoderma]